VPCRDAATVPCRDVPAALARLTAPGAATEQEAMATTRLVAIRASAVRGPRDRPEIRH
jgi:hypothetical protein